MAWIFLVLAGLFEMSGVAFISNYHQKRTIQSLFLLILGFSLSFIFLALALQTLPMGTAYAIWTGIGAAGGAILGIVFYGELLEWKRVFFIFLIIASTVGLKLVS